MRPLVVYVDDDGPNLALFRRRFDEHFEVLTADSAAAALRLLETEEVGVLISDLRMAPVTGIELLAQAAGRWPMVSRVLLTAYSDRELLLEAIQRGHVHDYVLKPWEGEDLTLRLEKALALYLRQRELASALRERDALREDAAAARGEALVGLEGGLRDLDALIDKVASSRFTSPVRSRRTVQEAEVEAAIA